MINSIINHPQYHQKRLDINHQELKVHDWVYHITSIKGILLDKCHNSLTWKYLLFGDSYPCQPSSLYIYGVCSNALTILMIQWSNSIIAKQSNPLEVDKIYWFNDMIILVSCFLMFTFYLHHDDYIYNFRWLGGSWGAIGIQKSLKEEPRSCMGNQQMLGIMSNHSRVV